MDELSQLKEEAHRVLMGIEIMRDCITDYQDDMKRYSNLVKFVEKLLARIEELETQNGN